MQQLKKIFTVTELTQSIKHLLEPRFSSIDVKGEITGLRKQSSGHYYFSLKDANSLISAVLFRGSAAKLTAPLKEGDQVVVKGELSIYAPRGGYQIIVRELAFAGMGALLLKLQELKESLKQQGWFDSSQKKALPKYPKTIGVVTSPTGSVIQDIIHVLTRRFSGFHLILYPAKVQGAGAAEEIAQGIDAFNAQNLCDVLIVGRGGGSLQDLWPFNEKIVAEAIHKSEIPVISAVGHETDFTICDFVADVRAPTPSAAAEIVLSEKAGQLAFLTKMKEDASRAIWHKVQHRKTSMQGILSQPLILRPKKLLEPHMQKMDETKQNLEMLSPQKQCALHRERLLRLKTLLSPDLIQQRITQQKNRLRRLISHLRGIDPKNLLAKGYCIPFAENSGSVIIGSQDLVEGERIQIVFHDGKVLSTIDEIQRENKK